MGGNITVVGLGVTVKAWSFGAVDSTSIVLVSKHEDPKCAGMQGERSMETSEARLPLAFCSLRPNANGNSLPSCRVANQDVKQKLQNVPQICPLITPERLQPVVFGRVLGVEYDHRLQ